MSWLEQIGFNALVEQGKAYLEDFKIDLLFNINTALENQRMAINESLDALGTAIQTELQQVRDALTAAEAAIGDKAAVEAALAEAQSTLDSAEQRVQSFKSDLDSDDPAAEPPVEPV